MTYRGLWGGLVVIFVLVVGLGAGLYWWSTPTNDPKSPPTKTEPEEELILYYPHQQSLDLTRTDVSIDTQPTRPDQVPNLVVDQLKNQPGPSELLPVVPEGLELRASFLREGHVVLDFNDALVGTTQGSTGEYVLLYSLVNSVLANLDPEYRFVLILVEGEMRNTIGAHGEDSGHIALDVPLEPTWDEPPER